MLIHASPPRIRSPVNKQGINPQNTSVHTTDRLMRRSASFEPILYASLLPCSQPRLLCLRIHLNSAHSTYPWANSAAVYGTLAPFLLFQACTFTPVPLDGAEGGGGGHHIGGRPEDGDAGRHDDAGGGGCGGGGGGCGDQGR